MTSGIDPEEVNDAGDIEGRFGSLFGFASLKAGEYAAGKKDCGIADDDSDVFGLDIGMPCNLPAHVIVDPLILGYGEREFGCRAGHGNRLLHQVYRQIEAVSVTAVTERELLMRKLDFAFSAQGLRCQSAPLGQIVITGQSASSMILSITPLRR